MVYKPKKWLTYFRVICLLSVCILINGITFKYEKENIIIKNENLSKNVEKNLINTETIAELEEKPVEVEIVEEPINIIEEIPSKYLSVPDKGFNVTTNNRVYSLEYSDFVLFASVVASEANKNSIDDVLAVASVILNRADSKGISPIDVVTAPGQFSGYLGDYYLRYIAEDGNLRNVSQDFIDTMHAALEGTRNNSYYSFRSWSTTSYSENFIVEYGNRYN